MYLYSPCNSENCRICLCFLIGKKNMYVRSAFFSVQKNHPLSPTTKNLVAFLSKQPSSPDFANMPKYICTNTSRCVSQVFRQKLNDFCNIDNLKLDIKICFHHESIRETFTLIIDGGRWAKKENAYLHQNKNQIQYSLYTVLEYYFS